MTTLAQTLIRQAQQSLESADDSAGKEMEIEAQDKLHQAKIIIDEAIEELK